jgi:AP-3 complex subunit delta
MFGYDMSWASFHVLEVMSSTKYLQKRVGYLGAVQSFRSDTEVLMLATNLLKKVGLSVQIGSEQSLTCAGHRIIVDTDSIPSTSYLTSYYNTVSLHVLAI